MTIIMKIYKYKSLPERHIRLLSLEYDEHSHPLRFHISIHSIDLLPPAYQALSYVWGDSSDRVDVITFDQSHNECKISVTRNLDHVLRRLRSERRSEKGWNEVQWNKYFWADAICINQSNNAEKSKQVQMMTDIYATATLVIGWLGKGKPGDSDGFELLREIVRIRDATTEDDKKRAI